MRARWCKSVVGTTVISLEPAKPRLSNDTLRTDSLFLEFKGDVALIPARMFDQDFAVTSLDYAGKLFPPFHQQNGIFGGQLIKADGFQLTLVFNAVEVDVVELDIVHLAIEPAMAVVFVHQGERRAGHFVRIGSVEGLCDSLHQG